MAKIEVMLPDRQHTEIESLVNQGEFFSWEEATEELLSMGLSAYDTSTDDETAAGMSDVFTEATEEQQDPAARDARDDGESTF